jgi:hypothetical protein
VTILSTVKQHAALSPLRELGSTVNRNNSADVGSLVNAQTVID